MGISSEIKSETGCRHETVLFWGIWLTLLVLSVLLFTATAYRGIQWQDSGHQTLRVITREISHPLGLALAHPLHHWLGRLAVSTHLVEPSFAVTLVSVLCAAFTVANLFGCVVSLSRHFWVGLITGLTLAGNRGMIILEDAMGEFAIRYQALRKNIIDLTIVPEASPEKYRDTLAKGGRIVLVPVNVDNLKTDPPFGKWKRWGDLYTLDVEGVDFRNE